MPANVIDGTDRGMLAHRRLRGGPDRISLLDSKDGYEHWGASPAEIAGYSVDPRWRRLFRLYHRTGVRIRLRNGRTRLLWLGPWSTSGIEREFAKAGTPRVRSGRA